MQLQSIKVQGSQQDVMKKTLELMGESIVNASRYLPIRNRAAALATTASPKDYYGQAKAIYDDFVKRWRYVRDPFGREMIVKSPEQIYKLVMGGRSTDPGVGFGKGAGDCDCACIAIGAQLAAIGFPVMLCVSAPPGAKAGPLMSHVFARTFIPGRGWITADPVVWPKHGFDYTSPAARYACYDLTGKLLSTSGNVTGLSGHEEKKKENKKMSQQFVTGPIPNLDQMEDMALSGIDYEDSGELPLDFRRYGIKDFGIFAEKMGILDGVGLGLAAEVETVLTPNGHYRAWTPALEITPEDFNYVKRYVMPYHGMLALGDNMNVYEYDANLGFFKKLFRKIKKGVKRGIKAIGRVGKKLLKKIPGGKYLLRLGEKLYAISKKLVKPLARFVGKYATKLAPVAALIPGWGTAVAAGLYTAGKIARLMNKHGVSLHGKKGNVRKLKFKDKKSQQAFTHELNREAKQHALKAKLRRQVGGKKVAARKPSTMRPVRRALMRPAARR